MSGIWAKIVAGMGAVIGVLLLVLSRMRRKDAEFKADLSKAESKTLKRAMKQETTDRKANKEAIKNVKESNSKRDYSSLGD
jgi:hypothetical protein